MTRFLSHIFRFITIALAFVLAVLAACAFVLFLIRGGVTRGEPGLELPAGIAAGVTLPIITAIAARYAFFPMLALILWAEIGNKRSWLFHALCGMAAGLGALALRANDLGLANPEARHHAGRCGCRRSGRHGLLADCRAQFRAAS